MTIETSSAGEGRKCIHSLVVDTGPLIMNEPSLSTLLSQAQEIYTIPSVISEIKDPATRSRVHTTLAPFLKLRNPLPGSIKFITNFSRRTGDLEVLSKSDIHLLALCYELEVERNGGDWRMRNDPRQKDLNGTPPTKETVFKRNQTEADGFVSGLQDLSMVDKIPPTDTYQDKAAQNNVEEPKQDADAMGEVVPGEAVPGEVVPAQAIAHKNAPSQDNALIEARRVDTTDAAPTTLEDDDSDHWITPSNLKGYQAKNVHMSMPCEAIQDTLQAALLTSDFAMQNVALRMNLYLVSPSNLFRIKQVKMWVLRCYGCFNVTRQMSRQFCPKCGQATLTRTSCSTDSNGRVQLHLKKNFQYNKRGNVYSIPKPVHGSANGKLSNMQGGGKNHWGKDLILAEDQKEYQRKIAEGHRMRQKDLMDDDYLPNILSGQRSGGHGTIRVGAGRNVNARKKR